LLVMNEQLRELVASGSTASQLEAVARTAGMRSLREVGLDAVAAGQTTRVEIDRVTLVDADDVIETENGDA